MTLELFLAILGAIGAVVVPFILNAMKNQSEKISKMEERIFHLHGNSVSKEQLTEELRQLEVRVLQSVSDKFDTVNESIKGLRELLIYRTEHKDK